MGRSSWFFQTDRGNSYDSLREAFVGERLNRNGEHCGCLRAPGVAYSTATIDCETQLELMREVLRRILREMPDLNLDALAIDLFDSSANFAQHYIWWLEREMFVGHMGGEQQDRLAPTDEGFAVLSMLELTKPGSNHDMSPEAVHRLRLERDPCHRSTTVCTYAAGGEAAHWRNRWRGSPAARALIRRRPVVAAFRY